MLKTTKVSCDELRVGMYVSKLDRPWLETPFLLQGFRIESEQDIDKICAHCSYVYIDSALSQTPASFTHNPSTSLKAALKDRKLIRYHDRSSWKAEILAAKASISHLSHQVKNIFGSSQKTLALDINKVKLAVEPMVHSIMRNPDACIWLAKMKDQDDYTYHHSLACSIWSVALGRHLGLPEEDLCSLAIGGLLFDIGKLEIDRALLTSNRRLSKDEYEQVKLHVKFGLKSIEKGEQINSDIYNMLAHHHERHNGSGYPQGLVGEKIPVFARIAGIVDCYDAISSNRYYAKALSPSQAINTLYDLKDIAFQGELIEEFIQAVGIYPAGTLVELSSGEVAIVMAEYRSRRLRPQLMVILDNQKKPLSDIRYIDLKTQSHCDDGQPLDIVSSLEPDAYGINMAAIQL